MSGFRLRKKDRDDLRVGLTLLAEKAVAGGAIEGAPYRNAAHLVNKMIDDLERREWAEAMPQDQVDQPSSDEVLGAAARAIRSEFRRHMKITAGRAIVERSPQLTAEDRRLVQIALEFMGHEAADSDVRGRVARANVLRKARCIIEDLVAGRRRARQ